MSANDCYLPPGAGNLLDLGGLGVHFKIRGDQTGGAFAIVEHPMEPHVIVEPHVHSDEDELSYVVAGTIWARVGEREFNALQGSPAAAAVLFRSFRSKLLILPRFSIVTRHAKQTAQIVGHAGAASRTSSGMVLETLLCTSDARNGLRQKMVDSQKAAETSRHQYTHSPRVWSRATARSCTLTRGCAGGGLEAVREA